MSKKIVEVVDPYLCPLCGGSNGCSNLSTLDKDKSCWCNDPALSFPEALIASLPPALQGKACICRACVVKYQDNPALIKH